MRDGAGHRPESGRGRQATGAAGVDLGHDGARRRRARRVRRRAGPGCRRRAPRHHEFSAQSRLDASRPPRTRLRVRPLYPYRTFSTDYPVPYEYEYPGPNGVRQCKARLVQEMRPSGPTVVPKMQCWWEVR